MTGSSPRVRSLDKDGQPKISEKLFQAQVKKAALINGWRFYHTWNSFRSVAGFPDCVLVHAKKGRLIFAELKSDDGKVTREQQEWLDDLMSLRKFGPVFVEVYIVRPKDFDWFWEVLKRD